MCLLTFLPFREMERTEVGNQSEHLAWQNGRAQMAELHNIYMDKLRSSGHFEQKIGLGF